MSISYRDYYQIALQAFFFLKMGEKFIFDPFSLLKLDFCTFGAHLGPKNDLWAKNAENEFFAQKLAIL